MASSSVRLPNQARFRVLARLKDLPADLQQLPSGMQVSGDIHLESMALWQWLAKPLRALVERL